VSERAMGMAAQPGKKKEKDPNDTKDGARAAKKKACHLHKLFKLSSPWSFSFLLLSFYFLFYFAFLRFFCFQLHHFPGWVISDGKESVFL
jgi:hypothetical protein